MLSRTIVVLVSAMVFMSAIVAGFWRQDWQYSLPTPRPAGLEQPEIGAKISVDAFTSQDGRPVLFHFFSPECPCSLFNVAHIRELERNFSRQVRFVAVLHGDASAASLKSAFAKLDLEMESVVDGSGAIGRQLGVYSTPQAALVDRNGRLYFRGNYNLSRYCTVPETEYARLALESLLAGKPARQPDPAAAVAYGCPLSRKKAAPAEVAWKR